MHRNLYRMELVVPGHLVESAAAVSLEYDEITHEIEKATMRENAFDHYLELWQCIGQVFSFNGPPRLEPFATGGERTNARVSAIRCNQHRV